MVEEDLSRSLPSFQAKNCCRVTLCVGARLRGVEGLKSSKWFRKNRADHSKRKRLDL